MHVFPGGIVGESLRVKDRAWEFCGNKMFRIQVYEYLFVDFHHIHNLQDLFLIVYILPLLLNGTQVPHICQHFQYSCL